MKKIFTFILSAVILTLGNLGTANAATYKRHTINQNFDGLEALPAGWSWRQGNSAIFGRAAGTFTVADQIIYTLKDGQSGTRGGDILLPSTTTSPTDAASPTWSVDLDWTINNANFNATNNIALVFSGSNSKNVNVNATYYADAIFGLYIYKNDGYIHFWNMDITGTPAIVNSSGNEAWFGRKTATTGNYEETDALNLSTQTAVTYAAGSTYHITAEMDFANQKMISLTITDKDNPANTATINNQPFLAPSTAGAESVVPVDERVVSDFSIISLFGSRPAGGNTNLEFYIDNVEVYVNVESVGQADVTVNYKDQNGGPVKPSRTAPNQEVATFYPLLLSDKEDLVTATDYYAYNAAATGSESVEVVAGGVSIDVIFKKSPLTAGNYAWTGATSAEWNKLDDNFSVGAGNISYQNGNAATFSDAAAAAAITIPANLFLDDKDVTISAEGYSFSGEGKLLGTGTLVVNASTSLNIVNQLDGGVELSAGTLEVVNSEAGKSFKVADNTTLSLNPETTFSKAIEGSGGTLNIETVSDVYTSSAITNVSTVNITRKIKGRLNGSNWSNQWIGTFPDNTQVNVINGVEDGALAGFGVNHTSLKNVTLNLGDSIRLVRFYNENANGNDILEVGALSGTDKSVIEGGFIDNRRGTYQFGGLNTDAEFAGTIRQYTKADGISATSKLGINKVGTGTWTLSGNAAITGKFKVNEGTLALAGTLELAGQLDSATISIAEGAALKGLGGTLKGSAELLGTLSGTLTSDYGITIVGPGKAAPHVKNFGTGNYDVITILDGNLGVAGAILDITVDATPTGDGRIQLFNVPFGSIDPFDQVLVNGVDITANDDVFAGEAKFAYLPDTGELLYLVDGTGIGSETVGYKAVKSREYYDLSGKAVSATTKGFVIVKTTYEDGSVKNTKAIK
ncbi:autotransporter outer membrane beta-barrel domain-containing protein [Viscerimonas tarda]